MGDAGRGEEAAGAEVGVGGAEGENGLKGSKEEGRGEAERQAGRDATGSDGEEDEEAKRRVRRRVRGREGPPPHPSHEQ